MEDHVTPEGRLLSFMATLPIQPTGTVTLPDGSATAFYRTAKGELQVFFGSSGHDGWAIIGRPSGATGSIQDLDMGIFD